MLVSKSLQMLPFTMSLELLLIHLQFLDDYVQRSGSGGLQAAAQLWRAIDQYATMKLSDVKDVGEYVVRIYANLTGLSRIYSLNDITGRYWEFFLFVSGFNEKYALFDFIDAGSGKETADNKLSSRSPPNEKMRAFCGD